MPEEQSFETQVLVSLERMTGKIDLIAQQGNDSRERLDKHEKEISGIKVLVYKGLGASIALAGILPIVVSFWKG